MSIIEYIILSFSLTIPTMVAVRSSALKFPIRLTRGLLLSFVWGVEHAIMLVVGLLLGNILRFDLPEFDNLIYLGLMLVVAVRMFFAAFHKQDRERPSFNISRWGTALLLGIATSTNALFAGLALGFRVDVSDNMWRAAIPLAAVTFLLCYFGIMFGRRKKAMRERHWHLIAVLFLLVFAIKGAFFGE